MNRDDENDCENLSLKETNWSHTMQSSFLDQRISCLIVQNLCLLWKDSGLSVKEYNDLATFALLSCEEISENVLLNISFDDTFLPDACGFCWENGSWTTLLYQRRFFVSDTKASLALYFAVYGFFGGSVNIIFLVSFKLGLKYGIIWPNELSFRFDAHIVIHMWFVLCLSEFLPDSLVPAAMIKHPLHVTDDLNSSMFWGVLRLGLKQYHRNLKWL